jgi:sn-glycerol 3-phosphate transport system substrate-binding protein
VVPLWAAGEKEPEITLAEITEPVTIQMWYSLGAAYSAPLDEIIKDFNAQSGFITVEGSYQGGYPATQEKVLAAYIANDPPVLSQLEQSLVGAFVENDALVPLEDFIAADPSFDRDDFFPELLAGASYYGKLYGFPINVSTPVLYLNRDLFRAAGLNPDDPPTTWAEVAEASRTIADPNAGGSPIYGVRVYNSGWIMDSFFHQFGGQIFSDDDSECLINSPEIKEAMGLWQELVADGSAVYQGGGDGSNMDAAGQIAMVMRSTGSIQWFKDNVTFDWGVAPFALGPNKSVSLGGGNVYMFKRTTEQEQLAAWEFLRFLTSTENQIRWSLATGYMVSRKSAFESDEIQEIFSTDPRYRVTYDQIPYSFPRPKVEAWPEIEDIIEEAMTRIVLQGESVNILDQVKMDIDELL